MEGERTVFQKLCVYFKFKVGVCWTSFKSYGLFLRDQCVYRNKHKIHKISVAYFSKRKVRFVVFLVFFFVPYPLFIFFNHKVFTSKKETYFRLGELSNSLSLSPLQLGQLVTSIRCTTLECWGHVSRARPFIR